MDEKKIYGQSKLGNFEFCPYGYYLGNVRNLRERIGFCCCRGRGHHVARKLNLRQKVTTSTDLALNVMQDAARDEINLQFTKDNMNLKDPLLVGLSPNSAAGRVIDSTMRTVEIDRRLLQVHIYPKQVEVERIVQLKDWPFNLKATLDSVDADRWITDAKSSIKKWTQEKADNEYQPSVYILTHRAEYGHDPVGFRYHITVCTKTGRLYAHTLLTHRTETQIISVLCRIQAMHYAIEKGVFTPTHQSNWKCSVDYCNYHSDCKFVRK